MKPGACGGFSHKIANIFDWTEKGAARGFEGTRAGVAPVLVGREQYLHFAPRACRSSRLPADLYYLIRSVSHRWRPDAVLYDLACVSYVVDILMITRRNALPFGHLLRRPHCLVSSTTSTSTVHVQIRRDQIL